MNGENQETDCVSGAALPVKVTAGYFILPTS